MASTGIEGRYVESVQSPKSLTSISGEPEGHQNVYIILFIILYGSFGTVLKLFTSGN